ncbi:MAG TPA: patatin [Leptospiraceae bacterium]|nr:patatin [Spirochaetaceae bacterium]HBS05491.1 patatin [Leptospiraceae bacterium]|tara:strand:+ start:15839 stop:16780 length:942 start_codon:yes stop_codon:yes gene_type:complete
MHLEIGPLRVGKPRVGLALGSGSARGWSHIGVLKELEASGIEIDIVTGTSAGGVIGSFYAADALEHAEEFASRYKSPRVTLSYMDFSVGTGGLIGGKRFVGFLEEYLPVRKFSELKRQFGVVATDLSSMQEVHISDGALIPAVRATVAVPGFLSPEVFGDYQLVDGGLLNPVPVSLARKLGADLVIAVDLDAHAVREKAEGVTGIMYRTIDTMMNRIRLENYKSHPPDITIEPVLQDYGFLDFHRSPEAIEEGRRAARSKIPEIKRMIHRPLSRSSRLLFNPGSIPDALRSLTLRQEAEKKGEKSEKKEGSQP